MSELPPGRQGNGGLRCAVTFSPHIPRMREQTTHVQPLLGQRVIPPDHGPSNETERISFSFKLLRDLGTRLSSQEPCNQRQHRRALNEHRRAREHTAMGQRCDWRCTSAADKQRRDQRTELIPQTGTRHCNHVWKKTKKTVCEGKSCKVGKERRQLCLGGGSCLQPG